MAQAKKEVPRWKRKAAAPGPVIQVSGRQAKRMARDMAAAIGSQPPARQEAVTSGALARTGAFRFRYQLIPVAHLLAIIITGVACHMAHNIRGGLLLGPGGGLAIWLLTRHLSATARNCELAQAAMTAFWVPLLALTGWTRPWPPLLLACWIVILYPWARHYKWRPQEEPRLSPDAADRAIWEKLAAKRRWSGHLGELEEIPGGRRYRIILDGSETDIGEVMAQPRKIAAAWGKAITEAYAEPSPDGVESRGSLTLLRHGTLGEVREWDGSGVDEQDGTAVIARYADASPARIRFFARNDGIRHGIIAGTTGAGKTVLLDLIIRIALTTGYIIPVILDPQEGQSLPQWRDKLPYAAGVAECAEMLSLVHEGMLSRSRYLASLTWDDEGTPVRGMNFFDPFVTGLPILMTIGDEYPVLLTDRQYGAEAIRLTADLGKRGRKTGFSLWPVAQVPSLSELGDQVVRSMLVGGNVVCLRTGDRVSAGMLGLPADPSELPRYFPDGQPTYGLGYVLGPDNRQAVARVDLPGKSTRQVPEVPAFDDRLGEIMARFGSAVPLLPRPEPSHALAAVLSGSDEGGAQTAAELIIEIVDRPMTKGDILQAVKDRRARAGEKPYHLRTITLALEKLTAEGRIEKTGHGSYAPVRARLHVVAGNTGNSTGEGRG